MNDLKLKKMVQDLTLNYFKKIHADISENEGVFTIIVSSDYSHIFGKTPFKITFDSNTALESSSELVSPGSKLLTQIINLCKNKGPISTGIVEGLNFSNDNSDLKYGIRFYFNITYDGIEHFSELSYVDFDIDSSKNISISKNLIHDVNVNLDNLDFSQMPSLFLNSSKIIRKNFTNKENAYVESILIKKELEMKNVQEEYDKMISEVDYEIKENERKSSNDSENYKLYDESLKKISILRDDQNKMKISLFEKYKVILSYDLICIIIFLYEGKNA